MSCLTYKVSTTGAIQYKIQEKEIKSYQQEGIAARALKRITSAGTIGPAKAMCAFLDEMPAALELHPDVFEEVQVAKRFIITRLLSCYRVWFDVRFDRSPLHQLGARP